MQSNARSMLKEISAIALFQLQNKFPEKNAKVLKSIKNIDAFKDFLSATTNVNEQSKNSSLLVLELDASKASNLQPNF